jgi:DNA-binding XRE family transcriptional regulator
MKKTSFQREIISKIRKLREEVNMSQVDFARLLDISPGVIGNIESIKYSHKYTLAQIYTICQYFHIGVDKLFLTDEDYSSDKDFVDLLISKIVEYES